MIRKATEEDMMFLFDLKNQPSVLRWSFNSNPVPLETHQVWFQQKLHDPLTALYVIEESGRAIGQVRFDREKDPNSPAIISIDITAEQRGKGFGKKAIVESLEEFFREHPDITTVAASIYLENKASQGAFARAGFSVPTVCSKHPDRVHMQYIRSS